MTSQGEFNWHELQTRHADEALAFYRETLGWQFRAEKMPSGGTYWIGLASGNPVCGILTLESSPGSAEPDRWVTYVHVDRLDHVIDQVKTLGGEVLIAPWDVAGVGRVAMIRDPGGAEMGWVTPAY